MKFLTDGDWASNDLGWQWSAGCGVDVQPRIPRVQPGRARQAFRRRRRLRATLGARARGALESAHPRAVGGAGSRAAHAGVKLGKTYPQPIVDLALGRGRFLAGGGGPSSAHPPSRA